MSYGNRGLPKQFKNGFVTLCSRINLEERRPSEPEGAGAYSQAPEVMGLAIQLPVAAQRSPLHLLLIQ